MKRRHSLLLASTATAALMLAAPAYAQEDFTDEVVTTGVVSSAGKNKLETSISVTSINLDQISAGNPTNTAEVLRQIPGIRTESSSGGGNSNANVRGIPISTGGAKYLSFQEDGLPVLLFGDHLFAPADGFIKLDSTLARVESVRGGTASTLTTNGAGGIVNFIGKTGSEGGGSITGTYGLDYDDYRVDAEYGGELGEDMYFHIGGHYQEGGDFRDSGYNPVSGGQVRASLTKEFDNGFVRVTGKWLDKRDQAYFPQLASVTNGNIADAFGSFDAAEHSIYSNFTRQGLAVDGTGTVEPYDLADGLDHQVKAIGAQTNFDLGSGINLATNTRYQDISGEFLGAFTNGGIQAETGDLVGATYFNGPNAGQAVTATNLPNGFASDVAIFDVNIDDMSNFANEIKLSKSFDMGNGTVDVTLGHFFMNQKFEQDWHWSRIVTTTENDAVLISIPGSEGGLAGPNQAFGWDGSNRNYDLEAEVSSPFLAASWTNDRLTLDGSLRFDNMTQNGVRLEASGQPFDVNNNGNIAPTEQNVSLNNGNVGAIANLEVDNMAWSFGANYLVKDNMSVFGRASSGASFNFDRALDFGVRNAAGGLNNASSEDAYVDEVEQYEVGFKLQNKPVGSGDLDFYGTFFYSETEESNVEITGGNPTGRVREYDAVGVELEANLTLGNFGLFATGTYTDASIKSALDNGVVNAALEGNTPQRQADFIWSIAPSYSFGDRFKIVGSWIGTTDSYATDANNLTQEGYSIINLTGSVQVTDALDLSVGVNNLFNSSGITESVNDGRAFDLNGDGTTDATVARSINGRTTYASLRYRF